MKKVLTLIALCLTIGTASAQSVYVSPYTKSNGTYVGGHYRSKADGNFYNNWSTKPNVNPYTGRTGTRVTPPSSYGLGRSYSTPRYTRPSFSTPSYGRSSLYSNRSYGLSSPLFK